MRTIIVTLMLLVSIPLLATPSGLIAIPSTDIQPAGVWHLGVDSYAYLDGDETPPFVDLNLTYGIANRVELGIDLVSPADTPLWVNGKLLLLSQDKAPIALAAGIFNASTSESMNQNVAYLVGSRVFPVARLTVGGYKANDGQFGDDDTGVMVGLDKCVGRWWYAADYISGDNPIGSWNVGVGYAINECTCIILGYDNFNTGSQAINFQFDYNFK